MLVKNFMSEGRRGGGCGRGVGVDVGLLLLFVCLFIQEERGRKRRSMMKGARWMEQSQRAARDRSEKQPSQMDQKAPVALLTPFPFLLQPPTKQHRLESEFTVR